MSLRKRCPRCHTLYTDTTLKRKSDRSRDLENWKYAKSARTASEHPILTSPETSDRPHSKWTSSDFVREITFQITGSHTFHAKENLEILREYLNESIKDSNKVFRRSAWQHGSLIFESYEGIFKYNFQKSNNPTMKEFLLELIAFVTG